MPTGVEQPGKMFSGSFAYRLLAPGTTDGYNLFTVEGKLLLETL